MNRHSLLGRQPGRRDEERRRFSALIRRVETRSATRNEQSGASDRSNGFSEVALGYLIGDSFLSPKTLGAPAFLELDP
jgi:hypothetical protein